MEALLLHVVNQIGKSDVHKILLFRLDFPDVGTILLEHVESGAAMYGATDLVLNELQCVTVVCKGRVTGLVWQQKQNPHLVASKHGYGATRMGHVGTVLVISHNWHQFLCQNIATVHALNVVEIDTTALDGEVGRRLLGMCVQVGVLRHADPQMRNEAQPIAA